MRAIRNQLNSTEYFEGEEFQSYDLAQDIVDNYPVATTVESDTIYVQNGAVWQKYGEQMLRSELWKILTNAASTTRINEAIDAIKHLSRTPRDKMLGLEPHKVVVENGIVDLLAEPGERIKNERNGPGTFTRVPVQYDGDAYPERFNDFLLEILPDDDVSVMWELIGYCLYRGYPFQKAFMFVGDGANGKSTLLAALSEFLDKDNIAAVELKELAENRFAPAELDGKLANLAPDISADDIEQTGTFKALTGGDRIRAERKYENAYHFENYAKLIFSANTVPSADDQTYAYERRWLYFNFPNTFTGEDSVPQEELLQDFREEHAGILNMAIESFQDLWERGGFEDTTYMREHEDAHDRATDPTIEFVEDELVEDKDAEVRINTVVEAFRAWCDEHDQPSQGKNHLKTVVNRELAPAEGKDPSDGRYKIWIGVRLRENDGNTGQTRLES